MTVVGLLLATVATFSWHYSRSWAFRPKGAKQQPAARASEQPQAPAKGHRRRQAGTQADPPRVTAQAGAQSARAEAEAAPRKAGKAAKLTEKDEQKRHRSAEAQERAAQREVAAAVAVAGLAAQRAAAEARAAAEEQAAAADEERAASEQAAKEQAAAEQAAATVERAAAEFAARSERAAEDRHVGEAMARSMTSLQADEERRRATASLTSSAAVPDDPPRAYPSSRSPDGGPPGRAGRGGRGGRGVPRGGRGGRGQSGGVGRDGGAAGPSAQPVLALTDAGDITGRNYVPESTVGGETTCIVCMIHPKSHLAVPCGHQSACGTCAERMQCCPYCRAPVQQWVYARVV